MAISTTIKNKNHETDKGNSNWKTENIYCFNQVWMSILFLMLYYIIIIIPVNDIKTPNFATMIKRAGQCFVEKKK